MADGRPTRRSRTLQLEYQFDRLLHPKLTQAYEVLVPDRLWYTRRSLEVMHAESGSHLRTGLVRSTEREAHYPEPDCSSDRIREGTRVRGSLAMAVPRRRLKWGYAATAGTRSRAGLGSYWTDRRRIDLLA